MTMHNVSGWKPDRPDHRDLVFAASTGTTPPTSASLRALCPRVENQGATSSCTAQAGTSMVEFLYRKAGVTQPELSRLFLYWMTRVMIEGRPAAEDGGAYIRSVMSALAKHGTCLESLWPFNKSVSANPSNSAKEDALNRQILEYRRCTDLKSIKQCVADGYPVEIGFSVPESIDSGDTQFTGVVKFPTVNERIVGGHAVLVVGYNDKTKLLCFLNSWGEGWGDKGYGYLPYEYITKGMASDFWTVRVTEGMVNTPPPPKPLTWWEKLVLWFS